MVRTHGSDSIIGQDVLYMGDGGIRGISILATEYTHTQDHLVLDEKALYSVYVFIVLCFSTRGIQTCYTFVEFVSCEAKAIRIITFLAGCH